MSNLSELNAHLFDALTRLGSPDLSPEQIDAEVKRSNAIVGIADQITENAKVSITAAKLFAEHGAQVLPMLPKIGKAAE